jgi:hypothetical protein
MQHPMAKPITRRHCRQVFLMLSLSAVCLGAGVGAQEVKPKTATSGPYRGISLVEVFTQVGTELRLPKNPTFELKVYRMNAFPAMNAVLDAKIPPGLTYDQRKAWRIAYEKEHKDEVDRWMDLVGAAFAGSERLKQYEIRFRQDPGVVINKGQWATQGSVDINEVIAQYQKEQKQKEIKP